MIDSYDAHECFSLKRQKQIKAAARGAQKDAAKIVRDTFAKAEEIRLSSGIEEAERDLAWADDGERDALAALCRFQCATLKEIHLRAAYLSGVDRECLTADSVVAMLPGAQKREA